MTPLDLTAIERTGIKSIVSLAVLTACLTILAVHSWLAKFG